jgi:uncharacterized membrane protein
MSSHEPPPSAVASVVFCGLLSLVGVALVTVGLAVSIGMSLFHGALTLVLGVPVVVVGVSLFRRGKRGLDTVA